MLSHYEMDVPSLGCPVSSGGSRSRTGAGCCTGTAARSRIVLGIPDPAGREANVDGWMTVCVLRTSLLGSRRSSSSSAFASPARSGRPVGGLRRPNICWLGGPPAPLGRRSPAHTGPSLLQRERHARREGGQGRAHPGRRRRRTRPKSGWSLDLLLDFLERRSSPRDPPPASPLGRRRSSPGDTTVVRRR